VAGKESRPSCVVGMWLSADVVEVLEDSSAGGWRVKLKSKRISLLSNSRKDGDDGERVVVVHQ
jgi:hypothetical protein